MDGNGLGLGAGGGVTLGGVKVCVVVHTVHSPPGEAGVATFTSDAEALSALTVTC